MAMVIAMVMVMAMVMMPSALANTAPSLPAAPGQHRERGRSGVPARSWSTPRPQGPVATC
eukprot:11072213-Lingulodinium_polyedra.AAC.1